MILLHTVVIVGGVQHKPWVSEQVHRQGGERGGGTHVACGTRRVHTGAPRCRSRRRRRSRGGTAMRWCGTHVFCSHPPVVCGARERRSSFVDVERTIGKGQAHPIRVRLNQGTDHTHHPMRGLLPVEFENRHMHRAGFFLRVPHWTGGADVVVLGRSCGKPEGRATGVDRTSRSGCSGPAERSRMPITFL